ncbi:efflux RND transporter periplasmic adaptor subunit [Parvularcula lutaonensis]|uniref:Efflux RND transporter periplasmic adaptor subunit n=1 Tax=Parvularcula lutaonensis TaxID=491923 RepID=A0ABV7MBZ6_9PROT|nr:efflux RND transporter periplasmic adaptor subunit [Parvularcula lutaonensis]GGY48846.1 hypothetical protein GCM10007148_16680 [Parvularcula lutaonensis]
MRVLSLLAIAFLAACAEAPPADAPQADASGEALYTCPMHPHYISTDRDGTCPICGMDLVPVSGAPAPSSNGITVPSEIIQTIGVRTETVRRIPLQKTLRAFGTVEASERLESAVASRIEGWVKDLAVSAEGDVVEAGDVLYRIFSPDLVAAQQDLLTALASGDDRRIEATRKRLLSLGMQAPAIAAVERSREAIERIPVLADASGVVARLSVRNGDYIRPGAQVVVLQSYSDVWVIADIPESDLHLVREGISAALHFPSAPSHPAEGTVDYVYPTVDPASRTGKLRIVVANPSGRLRPGAYADIRLETEEVSALAIPSDAILRDSRGAHVVLALGEGRFTSRQVQTGLTANGMTAITEGLSEGDRIVASGQFLLDSEVRLREGFARLDSVKADADTPLAEIPVDAQTLAQIDHYPDMALYLHEALTQRYAIDHLFLQPVIDLGDSLLARYGQTRLGPILKAGQDALRKAQEAKDSDALAAALRELMLAIRPWLTEGAPSHYEEAGLTLYHGGGDLFWLQEGGPPSNPYGTGIAHIIEWPEVSANVVENRPRAIDPHANH